MKKEKKMNEVKRINASIVYIQDKLNCIGECERKIRIQLEAIRNCALLNGEEEVNCYMPYSYEHSPEQHFPSKPLS